MKIKRVHAYLKNLALRKPYRIAGYTFSAVENVFLEIELEHGITGIGAASPAEEVVGETCQGTYSRLQETCFEELVGRDIRDYRTLIHEKSAQFSGFPGTQAVLDIALHDALGQWMGVPVVELYGQKVQALPTSVTIGIMPMEEMIREAAEFQKLGFKVLKVKTGEDVAEDIERLTALKTHFNHYFKIRVDANQGYDTKALHTFLQATKSLDIELVEQPLPVGQEVALLDFGAADRKKFAADESLTSAAMACKLALAPQPFGIFNIKLMKCGGILNALDIARTAENADIDLFWGCNDESIVSIAAALHAAFACPNTQYLDLDGSFDLVEDVVSGGFVLENGFLRLNGKPGLGVQLLNR